MKTLLKLIGLGLAGALGWWIWDLAVIAPNIFLAGVITGLLTGVVAGVPAGLLVLAATRRDRDESSPARRQQPAAYPPQRPGYMPVYTAQIPVQHPGYPTQPPAGSWYSPGPAAYDVEWPGGAPAIIDQ